MDTDTGDNVGQRCESAGPTTCAGTVCEGWDCRHRLGPDRIRRTHGRL